MSTARRNGLMLVWLVLLGGLVCACGAPAPPAPAPVRPMPRMGQAVDGEAIWYGEMFHGRATASGEAFDQHGLTAAHASLPLGAVVEVTSITTGKSVEVRINDRGHLGAGNDLALSRGAAEALGVFPVRRFAVQYRWVR